MSPREHLEKNAPIQCPQYSPVSVYDKHCKFYRNRNCNRTGDRCTEWVRRNPAFEANPIAPPVDRDLFGNPIPEPKRKTPTPVSSSSATPPSFHPTTEPLKGFSPDLIAHFKQLRAEICFTSEKGQFWLVPEYRDPTRGEISAEHLALICHALMAFPGATVTAFENISPKNKENSDE